MKKILSLTNIMVKTTFQGLASAKNKNSKAKSILGVIGVIALYLYLFVIVFFMSKDLLELFVEMGQQKLIINLVMIAASVYILLIAVLTIPSVFYFSKDLETLLPMPIKPLEILVAKTATTYLNLLLGISFILLPFGIAFQIIVSPPVHFLFFYLIASLIVPIVPLAVAVAVVVLIFTFIPKVNNKDMFTYFTSILMVAFIFGINFFTLGSENFINEIISGQSGIAQTINSFIPTVGLLTNAVNSSNIILLILVLLVSLGILYLVVSLFSSIYFNGAIGITETSKKRKNYKVKQNDVGKQISSKLSTLVRTDIKNILRTPAFAINYLLPLVLLPVFFLIPVISVFTSAEFSVGEAKVLLDTGREVINSIGITTLMPFVIVGSFAFTFFMASLSSVTLTAISREGERMVFYKSLPIRMMLVINAKLLIGIVLSIIMPTIILIGIAFLLRPSFVLVIIALITIFIAAVFSNVFDIVLDVYKPKLIWDNENQAIKQNFLTIIPIFSSFLLLGLFIFVFTFFSNSQLVTSILLLVLSLIFTVLIYKIVIEKNGLKHLDKAIEKL